MRKESQAGKKDRVDSGENSRKEDLVVLAGPRELIHRAFVWGPHVLEMGDNAHGTACSHDVRLKAEIANDAITRTAGNLQDMAGKVNKTP